MSGVDVLAVMKRFGDDASYSGELFAARSAVAELIEAVSEYSSHTPARGTDFLRMVRALARVQGEG